MSSEPRNGSRVFGPVMGVVLVVAAAVLAFGSAAAWGEYPTALSTPFAVVLAALAGALLITGLLAFGFPRWGSTRPNASSIAIAGLIAGLASAIAFAVLVGAHLSMTRDASIPVASRWVPVVIGAVALVVGVVGLLLARGDGPSRRMSLAGIVLGFTTAATTVWLASANCWLFTDRATTCSML